MRSLAHRLYAAEVLRGQGKLAIPADRFDFLWVIDFPLLSFDKEQNRWYSSHHPFTAPVAEDVSFLKQDPKRVRGQHYDIVVNGVELGGGSIRIHQPDVQKTIFEDVLQIPADVAQARFGNPAWRPSVTGRRRTGASPWGSTGWSPCFAARRAFAMSSRSRRLRKARI